MNTALPIKGGVLLICITIIIFLCVYFPFRDGDYFMTSIRVNAFIITPLYAVFAVYIVYRERKKRSNFSLLQSFSLPFLTLWIGGILSLVLIFLFFNLWGWEDAKFLKEGIICNWFEQHRAEMIQEYGLLAYEERIAAIRTSNLFNFWTFLICSLFCTLYYFVLSVLIGFFFRKVV
ncbi:MAG: DUF4199 domain-containing protein [Flavobacteriales bacterium AspAUS03]